MFKFAAVFCLVVGSAAASAGDYKFINADGSNFGKLCIAAAESAGKNSNNIKSLAAELGISPVEANGVSCNGDSLAQFAKKYAGNKAVTVKTYVVNVGDKTPESQLCLAALVSHAEFEKLRDAKFKDINVEQEIMCNGLSMKQFVNAYRDRWTTSTGAQSGAVSR